MSAKIDTLKIARLARLKIQEDEKEYFEKKFNDILEYVGSISDVKIESDMKEKDESLQQIYHDDNAVKSTVSPEEFSDYEENHFFKAPKVIE